MNYSLIASLLLAAASVHAVEGEAIFNERLKSAEPTSVEGVDGWRFLPAEIKHLLAGDPSNDAKKPLETIVDFDQQLKRLGVRLIVVPVPAKVTIYPEFFDKRLAGAGASSQESAFYEALRAKGVEVIDLTQDFVASKAQGTLYCARDSHWNGRAIVLAAQKLAAALKGTRAKKKSNWRQERRRSRSREISAVRRRKRPYGSSIPKGRVDALNRIGQVRYSSWVTAMSLSSMTEAICTPREQAFLINSPLNSVHQSMPSAFEGRARPRHGSVSLVERGPTPTIFRAKK